MEAALDIQDLANRIIRLFKKIGVPSAIHFIHVDDVIDPVHYWSAKGLFQKSNAAWQKVKRRFLWSEKESAYLCDIKYNQG